MSARSTFTASLTSSWFLFVPIDISGATGQYSERFTVSGADFKYQYQWDLRDSIGVEATPVYTYGLNPYGHDVDETLELLYQRQLSATWTASVGAGPLFIQSTGPAYGSVQDVTYAANASLSHQIRESQFALSYQRAFIVSFLEPALASDEINFNTHVPISKHWIVTSNFLYVRELGSIQAGSGTIYGGSGQAAYQIGSRAQLFAQASRLSQSYNFGLPQPYAFTQNQFSVGIRLNVGNPITRGGTQ